MKKLLASLFAAAILASLAGCGDADDGVVTDSPDTKPVPTAITGTHMPQVSGSDSVTAPPSMSAME